ncbi:MAG: hypothetical protein EHM28_01030 [Spirochaetaceae bacterium]|nr:MAG: hypothetical protein EHM28_01030 [Spirochaetaceae bacterium]
MKTETIEKLERAIDRLGAPGDVTRRTPEERTARINELLDQKFTAMSTKSWRDFVARIDLLRMEKLQENPEL